MNQASWAIHIDQYSRRFITQKRPEQLLHWAQHNHDTRISSYLERIYARVSVLLDAGHRTALIYDLDRTLCSSQNNITEAHSLSLVLEKLGEASYLINVLLRKSIYCSGQKCELSGTGRHWVPSSH
ncbi:hypothetical protein PsyrH_00965 [Pseudomonas syringae pv. syringae HS191]|nr:hypothetical protein PsyrH_00965 [Pseudomonas syringae pv. syringae HS191]